MKKEEFIERWGIEAYEKQLERTRVWSVADRKLNPKKYRVKYKNWRDAHLEIAKANDQEAYRKGGRRYDRTLAYDQTGLRGDRNAIRKRHGHMWRQYKNIIAPLSQLHHEWAPETAEYTGLALVEADQHMYGVIDVIQILDGEITLLTEDEIRKGGEI